MRTKLTALVAIVCMVACFAGIATADSTVAWSDAQGQRGTYVITSGVLSNCTINGTTAINGTNITAGNIPLARVTNALETATTVGSGTTVLKGEGSNVTNINGANISSGNIALNRTTNALAIATLVGSGTTVFKGEGSNVTNLNASYLTAGHAPLARVTNALETATIVGSGTTVFKGEGSNVTNLNGANVASGNIALARVTNALETATTLGTTDTVLNGNGNAVTNISAASLVAGTAVTAINGAAATNLNADNVASGNLVLNRVTNALETATAVGSATTILDGNGASITNITAANIIGGIFDKVSINSVTGGGSAHALVTIQCQDLAGGALQAKKTFQMWFTTVAVQTVPSEAGLSSWSFVAHGETAANWDLHLENPGTNYVRVVTSHTDGTVDLDVTNLTAGETNRLCVLTPNGFFTNCVIHYAD